MDFKALEEFCAQRQIEYKLNEAMNEHTSFKTGGPADIFLAPKSNQELCDIISKLKECDIPYLIIGKGSNLLVSDKGIEGAVLSLLGMDDVVVDGQQLTCSAGASLAAACITAADNGLSGLEFAFGIPGSVGGALYMNAGAYDGEMKQIVASAQVLCEDGCIRQIELDDMALGYRTSIFKSNGKIITSVTFNLKKGDKTEIRNKMDDFLNRRRSKQPLEYPSAGSTFKRPKGYFAGALIEKNNLKGVAVGGAMVSEKHAGFIINYNNATSSDIKELMKKVSETVLEADGVVLEPEVIFVGRE